MPSVDEKVLEKFKREIDRNLFLGDSDKEYWLSNASKLPVKLVQYFLDYLEKNNSEVDNAIKAAIDKHPEYVEAIKEKSKKIKQVIIEMNQKEDKQSAESFLDQELEKIKTK